jgi:hypothetical protein
VIGLGRVVLIPTDDQAPAGRQLPAEDGRLELDGEEGVEERCSVSADDAELIETAACGVYLRVARPTRVERGGEAVEVEPGLYQVIRKGS